MSDYRYVKQRRKAWLELGEAKKLARAAGLDYLIPMYEPEFAAAGIRVRDVQSCADNLRKAVEAKRVVQS